MGIEETAKEILAYSISNAVCVDNDFLEPYSETDDYEHPAYTIPKKMYESFKANRCLLDVYTYTTFKNWEEREDTILKNRDLLILDWELTDGDPPFKDALEILSRAIDEDGLQFIYIYTQELDLMKVILHIYSYFHPYTQKEAKKIMADLIEELDDVPEIDDPEKIICGFASISKEYCFCQCEKNELKQKVNEYLNKVIDSDNQCEIIGRVYDIIKRNIDISGGEDTIPIFQTIYLIKAQGFFGRDEKESNVTTAPIEDEKYSFIINNTLIKISTKELETTEETTENIVSSDQVYSDFSKTVWRRPRNFLALMGLEMRSLYRNGATIIGKDLCEIDELAFFNHQKSLDIPESETFYEFLKQLWIDEMSSFLMDSKPIIFDYLEKYKDDFDIPEKISEYDEQMLITNAAILNHYFSIIRRNQNDRKIRFGDIYKIVEQKIANEIPTESEQNNQENEEKYNYLLCITPACDCLRPDKIHNEFLFVFGNEIRLKSGLNNAETDYISFVINHKTPIAIKWKTSPFTLCIPEDQNNILNKITSSHSSQEISFQFICRQKEKYTQRVANQASSEASRVGVSFAKIE